MLDHFHENVKKIGGKGQSKLKIFVLGLVLTPNTTFYHPTARSESKFFWYTLNDNAKTEQIRKEKNQYFPTDNPNLMNLGETKTLYPQWSKNKNF